MKISRALCNEYFRIYSIQRFSFFAQLFLMNESFTFWFFSKNPWQLEFIIYANKILWLSSFMIGFIPLQWSILWILAYFNAGGLSLFAFYDTILWCIDNNIYVFLDSKQCLLNILIEVWHKKSYYWRNWDVRISSYSR